MEVKTHLVVVCRFIRQDFISWFNHSALKNNFNLAKNTSVYDQTILYVLLYIFRLHDLRGVFENFLTPSLIIQMLGLWFASLYYMIKHTVQIL